MALKIVRMDDFFRGIGFISGKIVFLKNALPEEKVEYKITKEKRKYLEGITININNPNKSRINNDCKYYEKCGGCHIRHASIDFENNFKKEKVKNILKKFAELEISDLDIVSINEYNYRNKITLKVENNKLGLLQEKSSELVSIDKCLIVDEKINEIINKLSNNLDGVKKIKIRIGNKTNEVMLSIDGDIKNLDYYKKISDSLIVNGKMVTKEYITSCINDYKFHIRDNSFFQVNSQVCEELYEYVKKTVKTIKAQKVLDLYCGVGTIGIYIAGEVKEVLGIEIVESAVIDAFENKSLNNVSNINFINSNVGDVISELVDFDTIIVDPPRSGLNEKVIKDILNINPNNIIYISCDPITLARDLKILSDKYKVDNIKLFNMFPRTYHVESVCVLERK